MNLGLLATLSSNLRRSQYTLEDKDTNMSTLEDNDTNIQEETEVRILVQMRLENSSLQFFFLFSFVIRCPLIIQAEKTEQVILNQGLQ